MVLFSRLFVWQDALVNIKPETFLGWHRLGFRLVWGWKSRLRDRSMESEQAPVPHGDILLRTSVLCSLPIGTNAQGSRPSWNDLHRGRLG
jgi:hypothetical protein